MRKLAVILMTESYNPDEDFALFRSSKLITSVITVRTMDEALEVAKDVTAQGADAIELCGAFGSDGAEQIIKATSGRVPVGHVVYNENQSDLVRVFLAGL